MRDQDPILTALLDIQAELRSIRREVRNVTIFVLWIGVMIASRLWFGFGY